MKPYYDSGGIQIFVGDCRAVLPRLCADTILSDPPYGINFVKGSGGKGKHDRRNLEPIAGDREPFDPAFLLEDYPRVCLWGADHYAARLPHGRWLAWDKLDGLKSFDSFSDVEFAWVKGQGAARIFRYLWKGICQAGDKDGGRSHPTQKPVPLMQWCLSMLGKPQELGVVCDPYMGSGTTLVAAKDLGLSAIGIEIDERYAEIAAKRLSQGVLNLGGA